MKKNLVILLVLLVIICSFCFAQNTENGSNYILVGQNGNKEEILNGGTAKEQILQNVQATRSSIGNNLISNLYEIRTEEDIKLKMKMSYKQFQDLGFSIGFSSSTQTKKVAYIYEISILREVIELGKVPPITINNLTRDAIIHKYGDSIVTRQEVKSSAYLFFSLEDSQSINTANLDVFFKQYIEQNGNIEASLDGEYQKNMKSISSRLNFIIDGIDYRNKTEREVIFALAKKHFDGFTFTTSRRPFLEFQDLPQFFFNFPVEQVNVLFSGYTSENFEDGSVGIPDIQLKIELKDNNKNLINNQTKIFQQDNCSTKTVDFGTFENVPLKDYHFDIFVYEIDSFIGGSNEYYGNFQISLLNLSSNKQVSIKHQCIDVKQGRNDGYLIITAKIVK